MQTAVYRFEQYLLDARAHALLKNGLRLQVQEQPFQVLLGLLEANGEIVKRAALHRRLWGTNTFVDFDQSLNSAVRRLRVVLGDDSRRPRYVETISRMGFRFLPPVIREPRSAEQGSGALAGTVATTNLMASLPSVGAEGLSQHAKFLMR